MLSCKVAVDSTCTHLPSNSTSYRTKKNVLLLLMVTRNVLPVDFYLSKF